ncbi:MAG: penicillin-binding protein 2 [Candidatus Gracilibacteria bacterium]
MKKKQFLNNKKIRIFVKKINKGHVIVMFFVIFALTIIWKMFSYTVLDYTFYNKLADNQQIGKVIVPVTRGTIYSSGGRETVLGTSLNLYDVAIDPQMKGDKTQLSYFLQDLIYKQICYLKSADECKNNLLKYLRVLEIEDYEHSEKFIKKLLLDKMQEKLRQANVTSVFLDRELNNEQISQVVNLGIAGIYPTGNYLYVNPEEISNVSLASEKLSPIIGYSNEDLEHLLRKRKLQYIPIINKVSIHVSEYLKEFLDDENEAIKKGILDVDKSISKFFILTPKPNRFYPENDVASQVIGFVDSEGVGHYGIEGQFNNILKGNNGQIVSRKDILGRIIDPISLETEDLIGEGVEIVSTIDRNIQKKVEGILEAGVKEYRANKGTIVIMEPQTGRIISMANYPSYDLNNYGDVYEIEKVRYSKYPDPKIDLLGYPVFVEDKENGKKFFYDNKEILLRSASREELGDIVLVKYKYKNDFGAQVYKNDAISALYEPGSIMKAITVAVGLDTGEINEYSMYMDKGEVTIDNFTISNVSDKCLGYNSFAHALNFSCNVGMIRIAQRVGKILIHQYFYDFGFGNVTGINLDGEVYSQIKPWERWSQAQLLTSSYGLGVSVTALQMAAAYSALANDGVYIRPRILEEIRFPDGKIIKYKKEEERRVVKKSTSDLIKKMLVSSASEGVAQNGNVEGYSVAGKTGTSQIPYKGSYEKGQGSTIGSYAGFGPAEDPKFVIIVKLDRPRTNEYGGGTSAFIFRDVASYLFDYYGIPKKTK